MQKGFTLIELLVVVLIIGILAAVAVVQYQKAVTKSRATQLQTMLSSVTQAANVYYLGNGEYPVSLDLLDVDVGLSPFAGRACIPDLIANDTRAGKDFAVTLYNGGIAQRYLLYIYFTSGKYKCAGFMHLFEAKDPPPSGNQQTYCVESYYDNEKGSFCKDIMGQKYKSYWSTVFLYQ